MLAITARIAVTAGREEKGLKTLSAKADIDGSIVLIVYFLLMFITLKELPSIWLPWLMISGDCLSKYCASFSVDILKPNSDDTDRYDKKSVATIIAGTLFGFAPLLLTLPEMFWIVGFAPIITSTLLHCTMSMRQHRFCNGDEGAIFLISELTFYIAAHSLIFTNSLQQHL
jgi:adenosylcobinamide-GDP ribazoletransferase